MKHVFIGNGGVRNTCSHGEWKGMKHVSSWGMEGHETPLVKGNGGA